MKKGVTLAVAMVAILGFFYTSAYGKLLRVNESGGPGSTEALALEKFKQLVEEKSNGKLKIRIYLQDALGGPQTSIENLMNGTLDLYSGALSYYEKLAPEEFRPLTLLWLFEDFGHLQRYLKSDIFKRAREKMQDQGIRFISTEFSGERGPYRVFICTKPIFTPDDLVGVRMRIWPNEPVKRCWQHMGVTPIVIAWTETYLAIKQGMIDAVTSPLNLVKPTGFTEVAKYVTALKQFSQVWPITVSEMVWQDLTPEEQRILVDSANDACDYYAELNYNRAEEDIQYIIKKNNAAFIRVNLEPFRKKMAPFYRQLVKEGYLKKEIFDVIQTMR